MSDYTYTKLAPSPETYVEPDFFHRSKIPKEKKSKKKKSKKGKRKSKDYESTPIRPPNISHCAPDLTDEEEWRRRLLDNLGDEELDFWHSRYNEPTKSEKFRTDETFESSYGASEEQYCDYINTSMRERKREKFSWSAPEPRASRPREKSFKDRPKEKQRRALSPPRKQPKATAQPQNSIEIKRYKAEYHRKWKLISNYLVSSTIFLNDFELSSIPWPFPLSCLRSLSTNTETLNQDFIPESVVPREAILKFLELDLTGPLSRSQIFEQKKILKLELLKWHPDKFHKYRFFPKVIPGSEVHKPKIDVAVSLVNYVSQVLQECWSHL